MSFDLIACGMGGQGVVLMCNIIGEACAIEGKKVVSGEMHGLSQRSGSVFIHQRIGEDVLSPLVPYGEADVVLSLELMEAMRYLFYLRPGGNLVSNSRLVHPPGESQRRVKDKESKYVGRDEIITAINTSDARLLEVDALGLAKDAGSALAENVVMVGMLSALSNFPLEKESMLQAVKNTVPVKAVDINVKAFEAGYEACSRML